MQSQTKNLQTLEGIQAMVHKAFGLDVSSVTELKDGWFNAGYLIQLQNGHQTVLKIAPPQHAQVMQYEQNIMDTEVHIMRMVKTNPNIPVPKIEMYDSSKTLCDSSYFFMEHMQGTNLEHLKTTLSQELFTSLEGQTGQIIREINSFKHDRFGYPGNPKLQGTNWPDTFTAIMEAVLEDAHNKQVRFDFEYHQFREVLHKHLPSLQEVTSACLVHWDAWNPNWLAKDGNITGIIDFERALWAEPLMEAQFSPLLGKGVTPQMQGYGKTSFTPTEQQRIQLYALHLGLVMHTECYYRNYGTDGILNFSRQYIADTMNWLLAN